MPSKRPRIRWNRANAELANEPFDYTFGELAIMENNGQVRIRLSGLPGDVAKVAKFLREHLYVLEESDNYAGRGRSQFVRRYLTVQGISPTLTAEDEFGSSLPDTARTGEGE